MGLEPKMLFPTPVVRVSGEKASGLELLLIRTRHICHLLLYHNNSDIQNSD